MPSQGRYTLEEYFALELTSEERYEYFDGEVLDLSGESLNHVQIIGNCIFALRSASRGRSCHFYPSNLRVKVPSMPPYRYPDLTGLCSAPRYEEIGGVKALVNPSMIVEVLSPSTEAYDRGYKFTHYKSIESFTEYLLIAQHRPHATHFVKQSNNLWTQQEFNDLGGTLRLITFEFELKLLDLYEGVDFPGIAPPPIERE